MSRNRPPRIEPKLRRPSRSARSDWRGNIGQPQKKPKITIGQKPHKWHNSFLLESREKSEMPFETRYFLFAAWDEAKKYRERRPVFGTIAQILIVIAFIGVFVFLIYQLQIKIIPRQRRPHLCFFKVVKQTHGVVSSTSGSLKMNKRRVMPLRKQLAKQFNDETGLSPDHRHEWERWLKQNGHWPVIPNKKQTTAQPFCVQVEDRIDKTESRGD